MKATITDVARKAGVAKSTVSKVLNATPDVIPISEETRRRVLKTVEELNYYPSASASALSRKCNYSVGLFCGHGVSPYTSPSLSIALKAINEALSARDYNLMILLNSESDIVHGTGSFPRMFREKHVDGLILAYSVNPELVEFLRKRDVPLVFLETKLHEESDCVWPDDFQGAITAVKHLFSLRHRKISFVRNKEDPHISQEIREKGYITAMKEMGLTPAVYEISELNLEKLMSGDSRPSAIVANHDSIGIRILQMAYQSGVCVPEELSVIGITNIDVSETSCPPLTAINVSMKEMGKKAAEMIIEKVKNKNLPVRSSVFKEELIIRSSTASFKEGKL